MTRAKAQILLVYFKNSHEFSKLYHVTMFKIVDTSHAGRACWFSLIYYILVFS